MPGEISDATASLLLLNTLTVLGLLRAVEEAWAGPPRPLSIPVVATSDPDWTGQVLAALGGPASVILDAVGGSLAAELTGLLEDGGTLIPYRALSGGAMALPSAPVITRELRVRGVSVGRWTQTRSLDGRAEDLAFALELGRTIPELFDVAATYDLADYQAAVAEVGRPGRVGTVLLASPTD